MAIYNYRCAACGNAFEIEASIQEKEAGQGDKFACPKCSSKEVKQEFSAVKFFKNIFATEKKGDCCSGGDCCGSDTVKKDEKNSSCCGGDDGEADCCSRK